MKRIIPFLIFILFSGTICAQTTILTKVEIQTDKILINDILLFDSLNVLQLDKIIKERPKISYFYGANKIRWEKSIFKRTGFEIWKISDSSLKSDNKEFILLKIDPKKMNRILINGTDLNVQTLTCSNIATFIKTIFKDSYSQSEIVLSKMSAWNGKYLISFYFKQKCRKLDYIMINCPTLQ